jgi:hypothetical protein
VSFSPTLRPRQYSISTAAFAALLLAAAVGVLLPLARPGAFAIGLGALALVPLAALALASTARAATLTAALAYAGVLVWGYTEHFSPLFAYQGLIDSRPAPSAILVVVALAAVPATWLPLSAERPSTIVLWFIYLIGYVPATVVPLLLTGDLETVVPFALALLAAIAIAALIVRLPPASVELPHLAPAAFMWLLVALALLSSIYIAASFGIQSLPSLGEVYDTRAQFNTELGGAVGAGYIIPWAGNAINPMLMAFGIAQRRIPLVALALAGQLLIYANTGLKSVLFSIALVPLVFVAISVARRSFGLVAAVAAPAALVGGVIANSLTGDWSLVLARRIFATPGQVGWYYWDYFSAHPPYQLAHSFLSGFFSTPYTVDPPALIGHAYFPDANPSANASLWADAFANFGLAGIFGFTVVLGLVLLVIDGLGRGRDARVFGPTLAVAGLSLAESGLFTTITTLGLGVGCVLIALMPIGSGDSARGRPPPG